MGACHGEFRIPSNKRYRIQSGKFDNFENYVVICNIWTDWNNLKINIAMGVNAILLWVSMQEL